MANLPPFSPDRLRKLLEDRRDRILQAIQNRLLRVGEEFVNNARTNGNYKDHTGNLRSSIGYILLSNGVQVNSNFKAVPPKEVLLEKVGIPPGAGVPAGEAIAQELAAKYPSGLVLICVAGMQYAAAVESKGFDVITSSALTAENDLKTGLQTIRDKIKDIQLQ